MRMDSDDWRKLDHFPGCDDGQWKRIGVIHGRGELLDGQPGWRYYGWGADGHDHPIGDV